MRHMLGLVAAVASACSSEPDVVSRATVERITGPHVAVPARHRPGLLLRPDLNVTRDITSEASGAQSLGASAMSAASPVLRVQLSPIPGPGYQPLKTPSARQTANSWVAWATVIKAASREWVPPDGC